MPRCRYWPPTLRHILPTAKTLVAKRSVSTAKQGRAPPTNSTSEILEHKRPSVDEDAAHQREQQEHWGMVAGPGTSNDLNADRAFAD
jgi:hypothetical protein